VRDVRCRCVRRRRLGAVSEGPPARRRAVSAAHARSSRRDTKRACAKARRRRESPARAARALRLCRFAANSARAPRRASTLRAPCGIRSAPRAAACGERGFPGKNFRLIRYSGLTLPPYGRCSHGRG
jgi:hypothetical protein